MKNELLKTVVSIKIKSNTSFPCGACNTGRLYFNWDTLKEKESSKSRLYREHDGLCWNPFDYDRFFH